jgi:small multidrug resistance pump
MARMTGPFADRLFRITFALAGVYNLAFGVWAGFWPQTFFTLFGIEPPRYPQIWACVGMVVGVYGLLYLHAAWKPDTAKPIIAVGFLGKILGPIGMAMSFNEAWPMRLGMLCIYNDLIWWMPFGLFLIRGTWLGRRIAENAPWLCVGIHAAAVLMLVTLLRQGTQIAISVSARAEYIASHPVSWAFGWSTWMAAAASLVGFYAWWGCRLPTELTHATRGSRRSTSTAVLGVAAVVITAIGMVFDFSGEGSGIFRMPDQASAVLQRDANGNWNSNGFDRVEHDFRLCSAGVANGLYTIAGVILTMATRNLSGWIKGLMWATWAAGAVMTVAAFFNWVVALIASTAILFPLLFVWMIWMGARWRPA